MAFDASGLAQSGNRPALPAVVAQPGSQRADYANNYANGIAKR